MDAKKETRSQSPWRESGNRSLDSLTDVTGSVNVSFFASVA